MEITLILAATRDMGIGRAGTLPWTGLRREMAYFAKVTKAKGGNVCSLYFYLFLFFYCTFDVCGFGTGIWYEHWMGWN